MQCGDIHITDYNVPEQCRVGSRLYKNVVQFNGVYFDVKECSAPEQCKVGSRLYKSGSASIFN